MPYRSQAQQGYLHAAADRGDVSRKVVSDFDRATSKRQYARLPEHAPERDFKGALAERYYGGGEAGSHHHGSEHDERRGSYMAEDDHGACQHFAHGGVSDRHDEGCPEHPMYGGGFAEDDSREDVDQPETEFEADERRDTGLRPAGELARLADGGEAEPPAEPPSLMTALSRWRKAKSGSPEEVKAGRDVAEAAHALLPEALSGRSAIQKKRGQLKDLDEQTKGYAQGGQVEDAIQHMQGEGWQDDERNAPHSPLAARLAGARMRPGILKRILRAPGSRVP